MSDSGARRNHPARRAALLRQRAEMLLHATPQGLQGMSVEDIQRLVHEFQVYQIELELQNEELRRTQDELHASRERYSDLYEFAPVGYLTLDHQGVIMEANLTATRLLGVERLHLLYKHLVHFVAPQDVEAFERHRQAVFTNDSTRVCEVALQLPNGERIAVRVESRAAREHPEQQFRCRTVLIDITARKQIEGALRQSEERYRRLAQEREQQLILSDRRVSFGELAASLAHEFSNPLGIILGFAQDLLKDVRPTDSLYHRLQIIEVETQRCKQLMQRLRQFARPTPIQLSWVNLAEVISQSLELVASECRKLRVRGAVKVDPSLPRLYADPQQLQQVLLNLYFNALEAMPEGGTLRVRATLHTDAATTAETLARVIVITVTDTGAGIAPEHLSQIFRPFFTTKTKGGMGLGLSICESIITAHGGRITVDSRLSQGATFVISLPVIET